MYLLEFASCILGTMCAFRIYRANWLSSKPEWAVRQAHQDPFFPHSIVFVVAAAAASVISIFQNELVNSRMDGRTDGPFIHPY